jgi:hypothetical protein
VKKFIPIILITIVAIALIKMLAPKQLNWTPSYSKDDKIPYGNYALYRLFPSMFPQTKTVPVTHSPYEVLAEDTSSLDVTPTTYLFINSTFSPDENSLESMLDFVASGNNVFIASEKISNVLLDTLNVNQDYLFCKSKSVVHRTLSNPAFSERHISVSDSVKDFAIKYSYQGFDTTTTTVLGTMRSDVESGEGDTTGGEVNTANFIRVQFGEGYFYLSSESNLYTNYYLLDPKFTPYITGSLSYLSGSDKILWDEHFKYGKERKSETLLAAITNDDTLIYVYYFLLIGATLYIFLGGKRRQRIIPIITPPINTTLEYVTTVGKLYFQHRDSRNIIETIINYFHDYLRTKYFLARIDYGVDLYEKVALKTGLERTSVEEFFESISHIQHKIEHTDKDVMKLNELIEDFKKQTS